MWTFLESQLLNLQPLTPNPSSLEADLSHGGRGHAPLSPNTESPARTRAEQDSGRIVSLSVAPAARPDWPAGQPGSLVEFEAPRDYQYGATGAEQGNHRTPEAAQAAYSVLLCGADSTED